MTFADHPGFTAIRAADPPGSDLPSVTEQALLHRHQPRLFIADGNIHEAIVVDVIDLECESEFFFLRGACRERIETLHKFEERDVAVLVFVKHSNHALNQWVLSQLCKY